MPGPNEGDTLEHIQWSNKCEYTCELCKDYTARTSNAFQQHLNGIHHVSRVSYIKDRGKDHWKEVFHKCHICHENILHAQASLIAHLRHPRCINLRGGEEITLRDYYEKFIKSQETVGKQQNKSDSGSDPSEDGYTDWINQCEWRCPMCGHETPNGNNMKKHLRISHGTTVSKLRRDRQLNPLIKKATHQCHICSKEILQESLSLKAHMMGSHNMQLFEYYRKFIIGNMKEDKDVLARKKAISVERLMTTWAKSVAYECQLCMWNRKASDAAALKVHLSLMHRLKTSEYQSVYKPVRVYHYCRMCEAKILHNGPCNITLHLKRMHKMTLFVYFKKYVMQDLFLRQSMGIRQAEFVHIKELVLGSPTETNPICWRKQVRESCKICGTFSAVSNECVVRHLKKVHNVSKEDYLLRYKSFYKQNEIVYHTCKICGEKLVLSQQKVRRHEHYHELQDNQYFRDFVMKRTFHVNELKVLGVQC